MQKGEKEERIESRSIKCVVEEICMAIIHELGGRKKGRNENWMEMRCDVRTKGGREREKEKVTPSSQAHEEGEKEGRKKDENKTSSYLQVIVRKGKKKRETWLYTRDRFLAYPWKKKTHAGLYQGWAGGVRGPYNLYRAATPGRRKKEEVAWALNARWQWGEGERGVRSVEAEIVFGGISL